MTPPDNPRHPDELHPTELLRELGLYVKYAPPGEALDETISRAEWIVDRARREHASPEEIRQLDNLLEGLRAQARHAGRSALKVDIDLFGNRETRLTAANAAAVRRALTDDANWAAQEMRADLLKIVERNGRIPDAYKQQLHRDLAVVLEICPHAGGLVKELTMRGQCGATGSASKLGSQSNVAIGTAYELMGSAALTSRVHEPSNPGAPPLHIQIGKDDVVFGPKAYLNGSVDDSGKYRAPTHGRVEADLQIGRSTFEGYREIAIDFKHKKDMGTTSASKYLIINIERASEAIKHGAVHEFHFVTNGKFSETIHNKISEINKDLISRDCTPMGLYEHVTTIYDDPTAN